MYAHIFGTPKRGFHLYITTGPSIDADPILFSTKAEAKAYAKSVGASPWNYSN